MSEKMLNTRIQQKHDIEINWSKAVNFIPKIGEVIVYDPDENHAAARVKIGDGVKTVVELAFIDDAAKTALFKEIDMVDEKVEALGQLVGDASIPEQIEEALLKTQADWEVNDETSAAYVKNRTHWIGEPVEYTYDGNYENYEKVVSPINSNVFYVKVSDTPLSALELNNSTITLIYGEEENETKISEQGIDVHQDGSIITIGKELAFSVFDATKFVFPSEGLYFIHSLITGFRVSAMKVPVIQQLDEKFIPSTIARVEDIPVIEYFTPEDIDIMCAGYAAAREVLF